MNRPLFTIMLDTFEGLMLAQACKSFAESMTMDLLADQKARRSWKARLFGHKAEKNLSQFPKAIRVYGSLYDKLAQIQFKGTLSIDPSMVYALMLPLAVMQARLEAQPDCVEKRSRLESLNTITNQLPVEEWQDKGNFWGEPNRF